MSSYANTSTPTAPSPGRFSTAYGQSPEYFGGEDYKAAKAQGASDGDILKYLDANRGVLRGQNIPGGGGLYDRISSAAKDQQASGSMATQTPGFQTSSGLNFNEGIQNLTALGNRYKDNPTVSGLVVGGLADAYKTQVNMGLAGLYNDTFLASQANYQRGLDDKRKGDTLEIMAAEIAGARGLQKGQIEGAISLQDAQNRGTAYVADRSLEGTRYGYDSQERQIGLTGSEERKTLGAKTDQELRLRADARGAIRSQGSRFYG